MAITGLAYLFLVVLSMAYDYPNGEAFRAMGIDQQAAMKSQWWVLIATYFFLTVPLHLDWPGYAQQDAQAVDVLGRLPGYLPRRHGRHVGYGQLAGACYRRERVIPIHIINN